MRWERIAFREGPIFQRIVDNILKLTAMLTKKKMAFIADRNERVQASFLVPAKRAAPDVATNRLKESRARNLAYIRSAREDCTAISLRIRGEGPGCISVVPAGCMRNAGPPRLRK
jgi:hypothetical protein